MVTVLVFGALGGVIRGLVGYLKHFQAYKSVKFEWKYFGMAVGISAAAGLAVAWSIADSGITFAEGMQINAGLAMILGYAGGDAIENLYKIILKKPVLGSFGAKR